MLKRKMMGLILSAALAGNMLSGAFVTAADDEIQGDDYFEETADDGFEDFTEEDLFEDAVFEDDIFTEDNYGDDPGAGMITDDSDEGFEMEFEGEFTDNAIEEEQQRREDEELSLALLDQINSEGAVFNIECWDEELKSRVIEHYPGYEVIDGSTGKIGNVTVRWNITPEADNAYQNHLDSLILTNPDAAPDDRIDLFLVGNDFAVKYARSNVTIPLDRLGITENELTQQFSYTKEIMRAPDGTLRGVTWNVWPGVLIYNRQAALDTWGTDEPEEVAAHLATWEDFSKAAQELSDKGYTIMPSAYDYYDAYASKIDTPWISSENQIQIRESLAGWASDAMNLINNAYTSTTDLWSEEWSRGLLKEGRVFCYPGAAWLVEYGMSSDTEHSVARDGGWAVCAAPQSWITRGTWICAAVGTDNATLAADIMRKMTSNPNILQAMAVQDGDIVNNMYVMESLRNDVRFTANKLGGQNPIGYYIDAAHSISAANMTPYDLYCDELFAEAMRSYFEGAKTYDEAVAQFYVDLTTKFPELSIPQD